MNKYKPHVFVLPEDDANSEVVIGFLLGVDQTQRQQMRVLRVASGWRRVLDHFESDEVNGMDRFLARFMVLLIDFDNDRDRLDIAKAVIPDHLTERVFILGTLTEPEDLKKAGLGSYENIGSKLAQDCQDDEYETWEHDLLRHNAGELDRLRQHVRPILFQFT